MAVETRRSSTSPSRSRTSTCSRATPRCARRWSARAPAGRSSGSARPGWWPPRPRRRPTARRAERNEPRLITHDRFGHRVDQVELDPSWHWLLDGAVARGIHALPWADPRPGAHVARAALEFVWTHANAGVMCPISMTYSAVPALRVDPEIAAEWEPRLIAGALCGMAMTEKQGGSDVRANTTPRRAGRRRLVRAAPATSGSAPIRRATIFLVLAQAPAGLSCFVLERGAGMEFQRLKDKLGTRSLPSSEVEFRGARRAAAGRGGPRRGDDHRDGHPHAAGLRDRQRVAAMRRGVAEAIWHARHRSAFGARLVDQPAMVNVLADLALESEAATATALRLARAYDEGDTRAAPLRHRDRQVLGLQARDAARGRGAGVPGRQRLRRGVADAAAAARRAAERDLGGLGQRDRARRPARAVARAGRAGGVPWPSASWRAAANALLDAHLDALPAAIDPWTRPARGRGARAGVPGLAARALRARRSSPTPSAPRASAAAGASTARCRPASTARRSSPAALEID